MKVVKEEYKTYFVCLLQLTLIVWYLYRMMKKDFAIPVEKKRKK